jgi:hypothetical protein
MPGQSARQRLRQRAGFLAENLLQRFFEDQGILAISFARRHLDEAGSKVAIDWKSRARALARTGSRVRGLVGRRVESVRQWQAGEHRLSHDELVVRALLGFCDLVRWEGDAPILSEVKSQYGPELDFRFEFQATQMIALRDLAAAGLRVSVLYYVALPNPEFVEIPWAAVRRPTVRVAESEIGRGYRFRARVPKGYRDRSLFSRVPRSIVPYHDEKGLLGYLDTEFHPGSRPGLEPNS